MKANEPINFDAFLSFDVDVGIKSWNWDFGDGTKGSGRKINHTYPGEGNYTIKLVVEDNDSHRDETEEVIRVKENRPAILISKYPDLISSAPPGAVVNFTINITNIGNLPLDYIEAFDILPSGLNYLSDDRNGKILDDGAIYWDDLGPLATRDSLSIHLVTRIDKGASGFLENLVSTLAISLMGDIVSSGNRTTVRVLLPEIKVEKTLGLPEPIQYGQYGENREVTGTGLVDISTSIVDKKLALQYQNTMAGNGDIELESENALSEKSSKLQRAVGNNTTPLNLYEATKMTYSGKTPLTSEKSLQSKEFYGGIGANIQEMFSVTEMEMDQQTFFASTDPASHITDQDTTAQLKNISATHLLRFETKNRFSGTWGTDTRWHKIFYKDIIGSQMFTGKFEAEKTIRFHEDPTPEQIHVACEGIDC